MNDLQEMRIHSVVGLFPGRPEAERAAHSLGLREDQVSVIAPAPRDPEDKGIGPALGGTVGGALGIAAGSHLGPVAMSLLLPGVGPVVAIGVGAAVLGAGGVAAGIAAGKKLDDALPMEHSHDRNDVFFYHEALRRGRALVLVLADSQEQAASTWRQLENAGAESLDKAREVWWNEIRTDERERYQGDFEQDEAAYRRGFEAALKPENRGTLTDSPPEGTQPYREGYERGCDYLKKLEREGQPKT